MVKLNCFNEKACLKALIEIMKLIQFNNNLLKVEQKLHFNIKNLMKYVVFFSQIQFYFLNYIL